MKKIKIFLNGNIVSADKPMLTSLCPGVVKGDGFFETMKICKGFIFKRKEHMDRLRRSLHLKGLRLVHSDKKIYSIIDQLISLNAWKEARVRIAVWKVDGQTNIAVVCQKFVSKKFHLQQEGYSAGFHLLFENLIDFLT